MTELFIHTWICNACNPFRENEDIPTCKLSAVSRINVKPYKCPFGDTPNWRLEKQIKTINVEVGDVI